MLNNKLVHLLAYNFKAKYMVGLMIGGLISGAIFYLIWASFNKIGTSINKVKNSSLKNRIAGKIFEGNIERDDILKMINYHTNVKKVQGEGLKYIHIAEEKFPEDREINEIIFKYYINTGNFKKAIGKVEKSIESTPNDADALFSKGFCHYKLG